MAFAPKVAHYGLKGVVESTFPWVDAQPCLPDFPFLRLRLQFGPAVSAPSFPETVPSSTFVRIDSWTHCRAQDKGETSEPSWGGLVLQLTSGACLLESQSPYVPWGLLPGEVHLELQGRTVSSWSQGREELGRGTECGPQSRLWHFAEGKSESPPWTSTNHGRCWGQDRHLKHRSRLHYPSPSLPTLRLQSRTDCGGASAHLDSQGIPSRVSTVCRAEATIQVLGMCLKHLLGTSA